jgi:3'-phosphoadenosine 5'-phosphosulfate sulfotransferase (PAPS reductase)/FAD synthetase
MAKENLLISFSGGRTSAMMTKYLLDNKSDQYNFTVVFANTGHERQATLNFIKRCDDEFGFNTIWVEGVTDEKFGIGMKSKVINYDTAYCNYKKNGIDPFEAVIKKHGISNVNTPHCSREMKKCTIRAFMRDFKGHKKVDYQTALGIRTDEPKRLDWNKKKKDKILYFAELGNITKEKVNEFWSKQTFDLQLKSYEGNCILCWKKSDRKLFTIIQEGLLSNDKELLLEIEWLTHIEQTYGKYVPETRKHQDKNNHSYFFMKNRSIEDLIDESYHLNLLDFAKDESTLIESAKQLSLWNYDLDSNGGCVESCEAF